MAFASRQFSPSTLKQLKDYQLKQVTPNVAAGSLGRQYGANKFGMQGNELNYNNSTGYLTLGGNDTNVKGYLQNGKAMIREQDIPSLQKAVDSYGVNTGRAIAPYNPATDPSFQAYAKQYQALGRAASGDTLAQLSAMTGGMPNSNARVTAMQVNQEYAKRAADMIPQLSQIYRNDAEADRGYQRNVLESDRGFNRGVLESDRGYNRGVFESDRGFNYGKEQDTLSRQDRKNEISGNRAFELQMFDKQQAGKAADDARSLSNQKALIDYKGTEEQLSKKQQSDIDYADELDFVKNNPKFALDEILSNKQALIAYYGLPKYERLEKEARGAKKLADIPTNVPRYSEFLYGGG